MPVRDRHETRHVDRKAVQVHRQNGGRTRRDRGLDLRDVDRARVVIDVDESRACAVAVKLIDTVMTSSPGPMPRALRASTRASDPELTPMQCRAPR
jgi:hypothetical protein